MKLWSFIFPDPCARLLSARVAAPVKAIAQMLLSATANVSIDAAICQYAGEIDGEERVLAMSERSVVRP